MGNIWSSGAKSGIKPNHKSFLLLSFHNLNTLLFHPHKSNTSGFQVVKSIFEIFAIILFFLSFSFELIALFFDNLKILTSTFSSTSSYFFYLSTYSKSQHLFSNTTQNTPRHQLNSGMGQAKMARINI